MAPEEQQYQWMRNIAALKQLGLQPSDLFKYGSQVRVGDYPGHVLDDKLKAENLTPYEARQTIQNPSSPITFQDLGTAKEIDHALFIGDALLKMFLGSNQPTKPVAPYRATTPTLR